MLMIRHLSGSLQGKEQWIPEDREQILFGRDKKCDVTFPEQETLVGRRHFALLRKPSGDWSIDLFGNHYVEVNGVEALGGQPLPKDAELRLGRSKKGPSFQVISEPATLEGQKTERQEERAPVSVRLRRAVYAGIAALLLILVVGLGWLGYERQQKIELGKEMAALWEGQSKLAADQTTAASESISADARRRLERGAYVVLIQDEQGRYSAGATAWPIAPSLLVTNAHVGEEREEILKKGGKMFVRAPGPNGAIFEVVEQKNHPGFQNFPSYLSAKDVVIEVYGGAKRVEALPVYDVALLRINGEVSPDSILQVAPADELRKLAPGTPLASAGYPTEGISGASMQPIAAQPETHFGSISAVTDFFDLPTDDPDQRRLIHHTIGMTGGSSGSPVMGPSGHVVAVLNAGSFVFVRLADCKEDKPECVQRIPNAALVNYAQRADLVTDLAEGREGSALAEDQAYWERKIALFKRGLDVVMPELLEQIKPQADATAELLSEEKATLSESDLVVDAGGVHHRVRRHKVALHAGVPVAFVVYAGQTGVKLSYVNEDGTPTNLANTEGTAWPTLSLIDDKDESGYVVVDGPDQDTSYTFRIYKWKTPSS